MQPRLIGTERRHGVGEVPVGSESEQWAFPTDGEQQPEEDSQPRASKVVRDDQPDRMLARARGQTRSPSLAGSPASSAPCAT